MPGGFDAPTTEHLWRADGSRLVEVWSAAVDHAHWVDLVVDLDPDGSRLVLRDRARCGCEDAEREDGEKGPSVQPESLTRGIYRTCEGRGVYEWSGSRYVRDDTVPVERPVCSLPKPSFDGRF
jgi:hypothetical protein